MQAENGIDWAAGAIGPVDSTRGIMVDAGTGAPGIEQHGVDYVSLAERRGRPLELAGMWGGALVNVTNVVYGALLISLGLSLVQAVVVAAVGGLSFILTGLASLPGPAAGTTAFGASRAAFGYNGNRIVSLLNWVLQVGYEAVDLSLIVLAALVLLSKLGIADSTALKLAVIVAATVLQGVLPLFGHATMLRVLARLAVPFVGAFVVLAIVVLPKTHLTGGAGADLATLSLGIAVVVASSGLGWTMNASDYSRYLDPVASRRSIVWSVTVGGYVPTVALMCLGAAIATTVPDAADPISGLPHAFAPWLLIPYLLLVIVQLCAINSVNLYSSGVTLQALGIRIKRWQAVLVDSIVCLGVTTMIIFASSFDGFLTNFLLFMIVWFAPWTAIFLIDYFLRGGRYDSRALTVARAGIYRRRGGIHPPGVLAQLTGMAASAAWLHTSAFTGPLSSVAGGFDLSIFAGFVCGGVVYWLLARRTVAAEAARTPSPCENDRLTMALVTRHSAGTAPRPHEHPGQ